MSIHAKYITFRTLSYLLFDHFEKIIHYCTFAIAIAVRPMLYFITIP